MAHTVFAYFRHVNVLVELVRIGDAGSDHSLHYAHQRIESDAIDLCNDVLVSVLDKKKNFFR